MSSALHLHCALLRRHCARRRVPCVRCAAASLRVAAPHRTQSSSGRLANRLSRPPRAGAELLADPWSVSSESLAASLFAVSLAPYMVFLFYLFRAKGPPLMNFGFAFLLVFVFATIPAGIYAKSAYGTSLANVDWLHGSAESLLSLTNLFICLGLRQALRGDDSTSSVPPEEDKP